MISRKHFENFAVPVYNSVYIRLRKKNVITCLHICGNIENRLDLISQTDVSLVSIDYMVIHNLLPSGLNAIALISFL